MEKLPILYFCCYNYSDTEQGIPLAIKSPLNTSTCRWHVAGGTTDGSDSSGSGVILSWHDIASPVSHSWPIL